MSRANLDNLDTGLEFRTKLNDNFIELYNTAYKTVSFTIGGVGVASCDFNFVTAADMVEQVVDLGVVIPALARIVDIFVVTNNTFTGAVSLGIEVGTTAGDDDLLATTDLVTANAINQTPTYPMDFDILTTAQHVFVSGTPGANWSLNSAGKLTIYISYLDITNS